MPSNYTIAKTLKKIADYRTICGVDAGSYPGAALEVQSLAGVKLEDAIAGEGDDARQHLNEPDDEAWETIKQVVAGQSPTALKEDPNVPLSVLELTEIKGLGPKTAKKIYDELKVASLAGLAQAVAAGSLSKVKGVGPSLVEKIKAHIDKPPKKKK
jgi:DNA polymerase/3'-5' exonuclease PolX